MSLQKDVSVCDLHRHVVKLLLIQLFLVRKRNTLDAERNHRCILWWKCFKLLQYAHNFALFIFLILIWTREH